MSGALLIAGLLIAGIAAPILVFSAIVWWRNARNQDRVAREPGAPNKNGWLWTILVLALLSLVTWKVIVPIIAAACKPGEPDFVLTSKTESGYIKLPLKPDVTVLVMPCDTTALDDSAFYNQPALEPDEEEGWTDWLARPLRAREMWVEPHEEIEVQDRFADGRIGEPFFDDPTLRLTVDDLQKADDDITGVRFRNLGQDTIKVTIHLRY